jgi:SulP family sulfate permease
MPDGGSTAHRFQPKLASVVREGYDGHAFRADAMAGLTVAVVALPLSMAIAVASGVSPERGLLTAVLLSGIMLTLLGLLRVGSLVRHMPHAVTVSFTCAIAVTIAASQLKDFAGLRLGGPEPGALFPKLAALGSALGSLNLAACGLGVAVTAGIVGLRRLRPRWPGMLLCVVVASLAAWALKLPVETIGSRFGGIPRGLPAPVLPSLQPAFMVQLLPSAISFALLGAVESLLSAKVADGMTGRKHRSNMELVAQGLANVATALFGGICVTGTIARTATNVRAGARSPVAGILHSIFLLIFMIVAAPLAAYVPLAALAGVLLVVCWTMAEKAEFARLLGQWRPASIALITFGLTLVRDLTTGIVAGCVLAALFALLRRPVAEEGA